MIAVAWLLALPFRILAALGLRRSVIVACLFVLAVTAYGVAEDLGVLDPPARAAPAREPAAGQPRPLSRWRTIRPLNATRPLDGCSGGPVA